MVSSHNIFRESPYSIAGNLPRQWPLVFAASRGCVRFAASRPATGIQGPSGVVGCRQNESRSGKQHARQGNRRLEPCPPNRHPSKSVGAGTPWDCLERRCRTGPCTTRQNPCPIQGPSRRIRWKARTIPARTANPWLKARSSAGRYMTPPTRCGSTFTAALAYTWPVT